MGKETCHRSIFFASMLPKDDGFSSLISFLRMLIFSVFGILTVNIQSGLSPTTKQLSESDIGKDRKVIGQININSSAHRTSNPNIIDEDISREMFQFFLGKDRKVIGNRTPQTADALHNVSCFYLATNNVSTNFDSHVGVAFPALSLIVILCTASYLVFFLKSDD